MRRTILTLLFAVALSYALAFIGHWVTYSLVIGRAGNYQDDFIVISMIETLAVFPLMSILVGIFVGWFEQKKYWWLAGVCLMPFVGYLLYNSPDRLMLVLCFAYVSLALAAAFTVSNRRYTEVTR